MPRRILLIGPLGPGIAKHMYDSLTNLQNTNIYIVKIPRPDETEVTAR